MKDVTSLTVDQVDIHVHILSCFAYACDETGGDLQMKNLQVPFCPVSVMRRTLRVLMSSFSLTSAAWQILPPTSDLEEIK